MSDVNMQRERTTKTLWDDDVKEEMRHIGVLSQWKGSKQHEQEEKNQGGN